MKRKKRVLVLFILAVVLVCGLVLYNTPPAEKFHPLDGYTGKVPWDFGGLSDDGKTVCLIDYSSCGKTWDKTSRCAVWLSNGRTKHMITVVR